MELFTTDGHGDLSGPGVGDSSYPSGDLPSEGSEAIRPKVKPDPRLPSKAEIEEEKDAISVEKEAVKQLKALFTKRCES